MGSMNGGISEQGPKKKFSWWGKTLSYCQRKESVAWSVFRDTKMEVIDRHQYLGVDTRSHNFKNIVRKG